MPAEAHRQTAWWLISNDVFFLTPQAVDHPSTGSSCCILITKLVISSALKLWPENWGPKANLMTVFDKDWLRKDVVVVVEVQLRTPVCLLDPFTLFQWKWKIRVQSNKQWNSLSFLSLVSIKVKATAPSKHMNSSFVPWCFHIC